MFGVGTVTTSNVGGGQHVTFIETGDWMTYPVVTLPRGQYRVEYRVASLSGGGSLRLEYSGGSPVYGQSQHSNHRWLAKLANGFAHRQSERWLLLVCYFCHTGRLELKLVPY